MDSSCVSSEGLLTICKARTPLDQLCLAVRAMGFSDVLGFLQRAPTPPKKMAVEHSLDSLVKIGALRDGGLTALGNHLSAIPADLRCSKLLILGALLGCFEDCLCIASTLGLRSPFFEPQERREEARRTRQDFSEESGDRECICVPLSSSSVQQCT